MNNSALEIYRESGRIAAHCREMALEMIRPGVTIREVTEGVEDEIRRLGGQPAFPAQSSRNHIAAHFCSAPDDEESYLEGDVVKIDLGVHVDGYVTDTAATVDLSSDGRHAGLISAARQGLEAAIETAGPGVSVGAIGGAIEKAIQAMGYKPVSNLTGHGVGRWLVHCKPQIPNVGERGSEILKPGQVVAIEPFATTGRGYIHEEGVAEVFMMKRDKPRRSKGIDPQVLEAILAWRRLPIARRYFREFDERAVTSTLNRLLRQGDLHGYPPLVECAGAMVAQAEHTLYIHEDGIEVLTDPQRS